MMQVFALVFRGLSVFAEILSWVIFANVILSWIAPDSRLWEMTATLADPLVAPFRGIGEKLSGGLPVDFSPTVAMIAFYLLSMVLSLVAGKM